ncbi:MAG: hypothetical protein ACPHO8_08860 [Mariniblastus sp.]
MRNRSGWTASERLKIAGRGPTVRKRKHLSPRELGVKKLDATEADIVLIEKLTTQTVGIRCYRSNKGLICLQTLVTVVCVCGVMITTTEIMVVLRTAIRRPEWMRMQAE